MLRRAPVAVTLVMLTLVWGCKRAEPVRLEPAPPVRHKPVSADARLLSDRNLQFACKVFEKLRSEQPDANLLISPLSISIALGMASNGAAGETRAAMAKALEMTGLSPTQVNGGLRDLKAALMAADPKVRLAIADSLWARKGITFKPEFLDVNRNFYDAAVATLDFADPGSARTINGSVDKQTQGLIPDIIDADTLRNLTMLLLDAVYFKGEWTEPFEKSDTQDLPFTLLRGEKTVPLMSQSGEYRYMESDDFQAISLPYGNGRLEMVVFLPAKASSLAAFCEGLTPEQWNGWLGQMAERQGTIKLPRFTAKSDRKLNDVLSALGMGVAFRPGADFSAMSNETMWLDFVRQKAYLKVDEEGTEAAAVTDVGLMMAPPPPPPTKPFEMIVDHPFFLVIRDNGTGALLFMGTTMDPGAS